MVRILVISQYFWPENFRINDLTQEWAKRGHRVTVLTGIPNYPSGRFFEGYGWFRRNHEEYAGAKIVRVPIIARGKGGTLGLALNYLSFALFASIVAPIKVGRGFDVIFVHEPSPITVGLPAIVMKYFTRAPIVFWVLDLWPESVAASGLRSKLLLRLLDKLVRFIYRHCNQVLVSSRSFKPRVAAQGVPEHRIRYFPNWAEPVFKSNPKNSPPPVALPVGFRVMFAGNIGTAQDFPTIVEAAKLLKGHSDIHWIVLGEGRVLPWLKKEIITHGLSSVFHLLGQHPIEVMPAFFSHADVMLVSLKSDPIFSLTVPAKVQAYLACGKPILGMLDGEGSRIIEEASAGICCRPTSPADLAAALLRLKEASPKELEQMGANALRYSRAEFSRNMLIDRLDDWLAEAATKPFHQCDSGTR